MALTCCERTSTKEPSVNCDYTDMFLRLTLLGVLERNNDTVVGIHNSFPEGQDVVNHLKVVVSSRDAGSLRENLHDNDEVGLKRWANGLGNVTEALKNSRLE